MYSPLIILFIVGVLRLEVCYSQNLDTKMIAKCGFAPGIVPGSREVQLQCCNVTENWMEKKWRFGANYLTTYLAKLQSWQCPQFANECRKPTFGFNSFSKHVYLYFCNRTDFETSCQKEVTQILSSTTSSNSMSWNSLVNQIDSSSLNINQALMPCIQVALFHKQNTDPKFGKFHEAVATSLPFCELNWCGTDEISYRRGVISIWNCMSTRCRANQVILMIFFIMLSFLTITANAAVIVVFRRNKKIYNSQAIYKISLAFADLLVGIIVIPTFSSTLGVLIWPPLEAAEDTNVVGYPVVNGSIYGNSTIAVSVRKPTGLFSTHVTIGYYNFVGFFTVTSFVVSVYTLVAASVDRFKAVFKPLKYNQHEAQKLARIVCGVIWITSLLFATLPFYVPDFSYSLVASILFASSGSDEVVILYAIAIVIPLLVVWIITILTYKMAKKHSKFRKHMSSPGGHKTESMESRLGKTLAIMVGVFTLSLLPAIVVLAASIGPENIRFSKPKQLDLNTGLIYATTEFLSVVILVTNSLWNALIYSVRNKDFRNEVRHLFAEAKTFLLLGLCRTCFQSSQGLSRDRQVSSRITRSTAFSTSKNAASNSSSPKSKFRKNPLTSTSESSSTFQATNAVTSNL